MLWRLLKQRLFEVADRRKELRVLEDHKVLFLLNGKLLLMFALWINNYNIFDKPAVDIMLFWREKRQRNTHFHTEQENSKRKGC